MNHEQALGHIYDVPDDPPARDGEERCVTGGRA
jgi:hypothetical protein